MIVGSLETALTLRTCDSFGAPEVMPERLMVRAPESSSTAKLAIASRVGESLTSLTVKVIVLLPD